MLYINFLLAFLSVNTTSACFVGPLLGGHIQGVELLVVGVVALDVFIGPSPCPWSKTEVLPGTLDTDGIGGGGGC